MKRACPFDCDLGRQLKVHVGQKEVNNGVFKEKQMQNVYDKTMNLLKEGSKIQSLNTSDNNLDLEFIAPLQSSGKMESATKLKQMFLNNNLQLQSIGVENRNVPVTLCGCCRVIDTESKCNGCDQILCNSCLTECANCVGDFCQNCLLQSYDSGERSLCLDCYR
ncbi:apoptosis regulatory protein Siva-like isoform X2 [Leptopilina heterotoma]|uniref:apoptosis regulatory protein Siva-like isoform X2 n=1 Tax=Leptopilina heterotoma TaxID=63436 RepID=UPI001CA988BE|nr:apoptosis regulatory protein Siva-like isoform X2 [Leptopilina heterotoma]